MPNPTVPGIKKRAVATALANGVKDDVHEIMAWVKTNLDMDLPKQTVYNCRGELRKRPVPNSFLLPLVTAALPTSASAPPPAAVPPPPPVPESLLGKLRLLKGLVNEFGVDGVREMMEVVR